MRGGGRGGGGEEEWEYIYKVGRGFWVRGPQTGLGGLVDTNIFAIFF